MDAQRFVKLRSIHKILFPSEKQKCVLLWQLHHIFMVYYKWKMFFFFWFFWGGGGEGAAVVSAQLTVLIA